MKPKRKPQGIRGMNSQMLNEKSLEQNIKNLRYGMCGKDSDFAYIVSKYQFIEGKYQIRIFKGFDFIVDAIKYGSCSVPLPD